jgi:uncharacterized protein (DUF1501 family)
MSPLDFLGQSHEADTSNSHDAGPNCGCDEFNALQLRLNRRTFIGGVLALGGGILLGEGTGIEYALADTPVSGDIIISLNMRGGMDGLLAVQPLGSDRLRTLRPDLTLNDSELLQLDGFFGLHPNLAGFKALFDSKELSIIHATGIPFGTRSHFEDQHSLEMAAYESPGTVGGWQTRLLKNTGVATVFEGVAVGSNMPTSLSGDTSAVAFDNLAYVKLKDFNFDRSAQLEVLRELHKDTGLLWNKSAQTSINAALQLESVNQAATVTYPAGALGTRFKLLAQLLKSGIPVRSANIDFDGPLDVHTNAGNRTGTMATNFQRLADTITAFKADLGPLWQKVTVVTVTEFGRRLSQNAQLGLDHGWASAMFVMGGSGKGGKIVTKWPGLLDSQLSSGDLAVTTDYRDVLSDVLMNRGGVSTTQLKQIFPNYSPAGLGLFS